MGGDRDRDIVELLETAKLDVINAVGTNARATRASLAAALRKASGERAGLTSRLSDKAFLASEFLREMAWMTDPIDPALFARERENFVIAMEKLIFEVSVTRLKPASDPPASRKQPPAPIAASQGRQRIVRFTLAAMISRWLRGHRKPAERTSAPKRSGRTAKAKRPRSPGVRLPG